MSFHRLIQGALVAGVALSLAAATSEARAQSPQNCVKRGDLVTHLAAKFHETPVAIGVTDDGHLLEIFASRDGATWTLAMTTTRGVSCLLASGQDWQLAPRLANFGPAA